MLCLVERQGTCPLSYWLSGIPWPGTPAPAGKHTFNPHLHANQPGFWDAFAGLWSRWRDIKTDEDILSATIIVTNTNETLRPIHDRMPVILEHENVAQWLSGEAGTELLVQAAEEKLTSWPVSTHVNKAGGADEATFIDKKNGAMPRHSS